MRRVWKQIIDMPPVWLLFFLLMGYGQSRLFNPGAYDGPFSDMVGWLLIGLGIAMEVLSFFAFRRHKTTIVPRNTPAAMITSGPFRISRNPIYLANCIILSGAVLVFGSVIGFALVPAYMALITLRFIRHEEAGLEAEFGAAFRQYRQRTRRWL